jgi:CDP-paratose 2-epimerase
VARFIAGFVKSPRCGEVYNLGGGRENSCSILEAFDLIEGISGRPQRYKYLEKHRSGDHICYISDLAKMKAHYPEWGITISLQEILSQIALAWQGRR